jgi:hypothetical protein
MNIGFTGHRDKITDEASLLAIEELYPGATWIHGGAIGFDAQVDSIAKRLGKVRGDTLIVIPPDYKRYGSRTAPLRRNESIVELSGVLYACWDGRSKGGTFQAKNYAIARGVRVEYLTPKDYL